MKDRLASLGTKLSGGQQQRLTIARALSHQPEILCLDEFSIAIDPVTTMRIEDVLKELRREMTIVLVTNLTQQARRLSDRTMFLLDGELVELDRTEVIFSDAARSQRTRRLRERGVRMSATETPAIDTRRLNLWYGNFQALKEVTISLRQGIITSLIGPSGCGKTTLLRCFNRVNERYGNVRTTGEIRILGKNIYEPEVSLVELQEGRRDGVPASQPAADLGLRERGVRPARPHAAQRAHEAEPRRGGGEGAHRGRPLARPQGPPRRARDLAPARAAAEAVHGAAAAAQARGDPDGRARARRSTSRARARSRS